MEPRSPEGVLLTENQYKRFVKVRADHTLDGKTLPIKFAPKMVQKSRSIKSLMYGGLQQLKPVVRASDTLA